jgi:hypothetical protein
MQQPTQNFNALKRQALTSRAQTALNERQRSGEAPVRPLLLAMPLITLAAILLATGLAGPF